MLNSLFPRKPNYDEGRSTLELFIPNSSWTLLDMSTRTPIVRTFGNQERTKATQFLDSRPSHALLAETAFPISRAPTNADIRGVFAVAVSLPHSARKAVEACKPAVALLLGSQGSLVAVWRFWQAVSAQTARKACAAISDRLGGTPIDLTMPVPGKSGFKRLLLNPGALVVPTDLMGGLKIKPAPALVSTSFADMEETTVEWLMPNTIPLGYLTLLGGLPDAGKSQITINIASIVSRGGQWPCELGRADRGDVLILASEDGSEDVIKPRLAAAGADMSRIHSMRKRFSIGENLPDLKALGESLKYLRLIVFDPISRYMSGKDAAAVRDAVDDFNLWISERKIAAIGIRHPPKDVQPNVQSLFSGSAEEVRIARAAWFVAGGNSVGMEGCGLMLNAKGNIIPDKRAFPYRIEGVTTKAGSVTSRIVWAGERIDTTAQQYLTEHKSKKR